MASWGQFCPPVAAPGAPPGCVGRVILSLCWEKLPRETCLVSPHSLQAAQSSIGSGTPRIPAGVLVVSGAVSRYWRLPWSVLFSMSLKWDITRNVFVLVVECWTEENSARPKKGAQEDHHCVCEGGCAPEEGRECLEAEPEEGKPNRGP